jgi:methylthioribose-1-phosphate isomerase
MKIPALRWIDPPRGPAIALLDQTMLPAQETVVTCSTVAELVAAIRRLVVRGAPLLGVAGAYGVALAAYRGDDVPAAAERLATARPTAVNLGWGARRALAAYQAAELTREAGQHTGTAGQHIGTAGQQRSTAGQQTSTAGQRTSRPASAAAALAEARSIARQDADASAAMARRGLALIPPRARILTHCNTGALVSAGSGTAFAVALAAHQAGRLAKLWVDETRPLLQGARLTAYEAQQAGMDYSVLVDSAAAALFARGLVDIVLTGADRVAADGSVANKIGTYGLAVLARHHGIPFVVVAPVSTIDFATPSGDAIVVEQRAGEEVTRVAGTAIAPAGSAAYNPAFDVTPPDLVSALVTECGVAQPVTPGTLRFLGGFTAKAEAAQINIPVER